MKHLRLMPFLCLTLLSGAGLAHAAPGDLDTTFASTGKKTRNIGQNDRGQAVAIQSDGKIVTVGTSTSSFDYSDFAVYRCNANGTDDTTFGSSGVVTVNFRNDPTRSKDGGHAIAIQSDGKIIVAGAIDNSTTPGFEFGLARLNTNGTLDTTFGTGGRVILNPTSGEELALSVAIQSDGKIVVAGYGFVYNGTTTTRDFVVTRLTTAGATDTTFGTSGSTVINFGGDDVCQKVLIQSDGKIVLIGDTYTSSGKFAVARLTTTGALDTSYGVGGKSTVSFGTGISSGATAAALQSNNYLVLGGSAYDGSTQNVALARLNITGGLDSTFGGSSTGRTTIGWTGSYRNLLGLALQSDGKVVFVGDTDANNASGNTNSYVARLNSNGTIDGTFASTFPVVTTWSGLSSYDDVAIQTNGKIVAVGVTAITGAEDFIVGRYVGSTPSTSSSAASSSGGVS